MIFFLLGYLKNLAINDIGTADNSQNDKDGYKNTSGPQPFVKVQSNKKTKSNAAGHGKAELCYNIKILDPGAVFFIVEYLFFFGIVPIYNCLYLLYCFNAL